MQKSPLQGLTESQARASRQKNGANVLTRQKRAGFFRQLLESFGDPIIKILLAALALNVLFLFRSHSWYEPVGIAVAVFLATFVSTLSEYGSEKAFLRLQEEASRTKCRVLRSGRLQELPVTEVVVGDLVELAAGDRIPADGTLISGQLFVDQSALNGESREAEKSPGQPGEHRDPGDTHGLFSGSVVTQGRGRMQVTRVGDHTLYGGIAAELQSDTRESPLRVRLNHLARLLSRLGYCAAALVAAADLVNSLLLANGMDPARMMAAVQNLPALTGHLLHAVTLAITVVVVAVPEGLPMMITVVLSANMRRMLRDRVLVRRLTGIETSGSLNILFTDKTGTLTEGKLEAVSFSAGGRQLRRFSELQREEAPLRDLLTAVCALGSEAAFEGNRILGGNATDRALLQAALPLPPRLQGRRGEVLVPFDSARKWSCARVTLDRTLYVYKGAPERLLPRCTSRVDRLGRRVPRFSQGTAERQQREMAARAMRVLALAVSDRPPEGDQLPELCYLGLAGLRDDLRRTAREAVRAVQGAGVQVVMVTGDNRDTAEAIAREAGLLEGGGEILTSAEMEKLSDEALARRIPRLRVVARALPADKNRLVRLAEEQGLVAGMTGDGINDAPALRRADVGFAMGGGTEVAKEAGDIVILDNDFASIAKAILYGRTIFKSIRKFLVFQLTMNLCAVGVSIVGPFLGIDTPVTVLQMLWINIIMDALAGLAFAGEPPRKEYMTEPPKRREEPVLTREMLGQIGATGLYTVALCSAFLALAPELGAFRYQENPIYLMTAFFALFIFCGIFNSFSARTPRLWLLGGLRQNPAFTGIMTAVTGVQLILIYFGGTMFRTAPLLPEELLTVAVLAATVLPADLIRKAILRRKNAKKRALSKRSEP